MTTAAMITVVGRFAVEGGLNLLRGERLGPLLLGRLLQGHDL